MRTIAVIIVLITLLGNRQVSCQETKEQIDVRAFPLRYATAAEAAVVLNEQFPEVVFSSQNSTNLVYGRVPNGPMQLEIAELIQMMEQVAAAQLEDEKAKRQEEKHRREQEYREQQKARNASNTNAGLRDRKLSVIELNHISSSEASAVVNQMEYSGVDKIVSVDRNNTLLVTANEEGLTQIESILEILDVPVEKNNRSEAGFDPVRHAPITSAQRRSSTPMSEHINEQLREVQLELAEVSAEFGHNHPRAKELRSRISMLENQYKNLRKSEPLLRSDEAPRIPQSQFIVDSLIKIRPDLKVGVMTQNTGQIKVNGSEKDVHEFETLLHSIESLDGEVIQLQALYDEAESSAASLAKTLRDEKDRMDDSTTLLEEDARVSELINNLRGCVRQAFELRIQLQSAQLDKAEEDLITSRKRIDDRRKLASQIVDRRVEQLIKGETDMPQNERRSDNTK